MHKVSYLNDEIKIPCLGGIFAFADDFSIWLSFDVINKFLSSWLHSNRLDHGNSTHSHPSFPGSPSCTSEKIRNGLEDLLHNLLLKTHS